MQDQTITVQGITIRYRDTGGPGTPILLSHGIGGSLELWSRQLDALGAPHRLIAWDYPGHGESAAWDKTFEPDGLAEFGLAFIDALGLDRVIFVGNSLGGAISIRMADARPELAAGLMLAAPAMVGPEVFPPFRLMVLPVIGKAMTAPSEKGVEMALSAMISKKDTITDEMRSFMRRNQFHEGQNPNFRDTLVATLGPIAGCKAAFIKPAREMLARTTCPLVLFHGADDKIFPPKQSRELHALVPGSTLIVQENCGHTPQWEAPEAFNAALTELARKAA